MFVVYSCIFECCGLNFCVVIVDLGVMGGKDMYEFMVFFEIGEDIIVYLDIFFYVVNVEMVLVVNMYGKLGEVEKELIKVEILN